MRSRDTLIKIWRQVPPDYYQKGITGNILQKYWHGQKIKTFKKLVNSKDFRSILDVGCASGSMTNEISKILPQSKITGIDAYSKAVMYGRKKYPHLNLLTADAHKIPFKSRNFDLVVCYETIEHVVDPAKVLSEILRVVSKNGRAIVAMDSGRLPFRLIWWIWERTKGRVWRGAHLHPFKHKELERLIKKSGFKILNKQFTHFGLEVVFLLKAGR